jgi:hypothetical protein
MISLDASEAVHVVTGPCAGCHELIGPNATISKTPFVLDDGFPSSVAFEVTELASQWLACAH